MRRERVLSIAVLRIELMTLPRAVTDRVGPAWAARLRRPGYLLLPLRAFLGITFCYAGLQKLANPAYLDSNNPASVYAQMHALEHQSPIGPLVSLSTHAPTLVGLLIALGELAVGVGTLLGLLSRIAAAGGLLLALTFFLTVSWNTTPYYYGADIVFVFAWTVLLAFGSGGVLSLETWLRNRARVRMGAPPEPVDVPLPATRVRDLCSHGARCGLGITSGICGRPRTCPVFAPSERVPPARAAELDRRAVLATAAGVAGVGIATAFVAGTTAAVGRAHNQSSTPAAAPPPQPAPQSSSPANSGHHSSAPKPQPSGTVIAAASAVPVGHAKSFLDPHSQQPAWLVHVSAAEFVAFSAVCTHAGCGVGYDQANEQFICPCHGGTYDAKTGQVLAGPPPTPLPKIPVTVTDGKVTTT
jgi:thiosulfate dehydrogenase (quinone) large subunit